MKRYLASLRDRQVNFSTPVEEMTVENGWTVDGVESLLGREAPGPPEPDGLYERARRGIEQYDFSDPSIVVGHFDPEAPLVGRDMVIEIKLWGLRYLNGVRVHSVREESDETRTRFGFRYDTLEGHLERGCESFLLWKVHAAGEVRFLIQAHWRLGQFPNWWSRVGFGLVGERFRERWRHRAPERLRALARGGDPSCRPNGGPR